MSQLPIERRDFLRGSAALLSVGLAPQGIARPISAKPLNFLVVGDWGRDGHAHQRAVAARMAQEARETDAQFIVSTGDNFYNFGVSSATDSQWESSFENIYAEEPLQRCWYAALGNHDYGGSVHAQVRRTGRGAWQMRDRWYAISGALHGRPEIDLFVIDTPVWIGRESFPYGWLGSSIDRADQQAQTLWLTEKLLSSTAPFKLVFGHHPIYSVGKHGGKARMLELDRLFRRTGVTAYVCGHDHCLYHIQSSAMDYVCSGGGSEERSEYTGIKSVPGCVLLEHCPNGILKPGRPEALRFLPMAGFASFSVGDQGVAFRFIDRCGRKCDYTALRERLPDTDVRLDREV